MVALSSAMGFVLAHSRVLHEINECRHAKRKAVSVPSCVEPAYSLTTAAFARVEL
jgi:hypothetical protein